MTDVLFEPFPRKVLLVDDEPVVLDLLSRALAREKVEHQSVQHGDAAIALLEQTAYGCLVVDKNLPQTDGLAVMRRARALQPGIGVIMVTGFASTASVIESLRLGADDYLEKPFVDLGLVTAKVLAVLEARRNLHERSALGRAVERLQVTEGAHLDALASDAQVIRAFQAVLEQRVGEATADLRAACEQLQQQVSAHGRPRSDIVDRVVTLREGLAHVPLDDAPALRTALENALKTLATQRDSLLE